MNRADQVSGVTTVAIFNLVVWGVIFVVVIIKLAGSIRIVPTQSAFIVERLGRYDKTLQPGFHLLVPFIETVAFVQSLKEEAVDVPPQECFTRDNVQVEVDGVLYMQVTDAVNASYGVTDYQYAAIQLAQTTTRAVIGLLELDRTFEERDEINSRVVKVLQEVENQWGLSVKRFEVKNIVPPQSVKDSMEKQMSAERERRALISQSEGRRQSQIDKSEGAKMQTINQSEGEMQRRINEAEGRARAIETIGDATAKSIETLAAAISGEGGEDAVRLRISQQYLRNLGHLADPKTKVVLPADLSNVEALLASLGLSLQNEPGTGTNPVKGGTAPTAGR